MAAGKTYRVVIASPAIKRYHEIILPYIYENFSFIRAKEVDSNILQTVATLNKVPGRGRKEKYLATANEEFRFILHRETKNFELKIIYFVDEQSSKVYVTDFFPTKMQPQKMVDDKS